jgi:hypothetical protein
MSKKKGTSSVPLIMGIIGGVISLPSALCSHMCASCADGIGEVAAAQYGNTVNKDEQIGTTFLWFTVISGLLGLIGGILGKRLPVPAGVIMIVAALLSGITMFMGNLIAILVAILFLIGGAMCFAQKKEELK